MKTACKDVLKPIQRLCHPSGRGRNLNFWQAFGLSLGMSLLMTGLALLAQRLLDKKRS